MVGMWRVSEGRAKAERRQGEGRVEEWMSRDG